jgi:hypothetical protein
MIILIWIMNIYNYIYNENIIYGIMDIYNYINNDNIICVWDIKL